MEYLLDFLREAMDYIFSPIRDAIYLLFLALIIYFLYRCVKYFQRINAAKYSYLQELNRIDQMDGRSFEHRCARLLRNNGFTRVEVTRSSGDQGVDILAHKDGRKYAVQCKCYRKNVGNKAIQEAYTGKAIYRCDVAAVMTNRDFTDSAFQAARATGIALWGRRELIIMLKNEETIIKGAATKAVTPIHKRGMMLLSDVSKHVSGLADFSKFDIIPRYWPHNRGSMKIDFEHYRKIVVPEVPSDMPHYVRMFPLGGPETCFNLSEGELEGPEGVMLELLTDPFQTRQQAIYFEKFFEKKYYALIQPGQHVLDGDHTKSVRCFVWAKYVFDCFYENGGYFIFEST